RSSRRRRSRPIPEEGSRTKRSGAKESKRKRSTTWSSSTRAPMTSFSPKLPSTGSSLHQSSLMLEGNFDSFLFHSSLF
ncbi:hypothetical protein LINPERPRIM_LOCUS5134, partial [Linum perenne]